VLGRYRFETFRRSACLEWLYQTLCSYAKYLDVSTLLTIKIDVISPASSAIDCQHCNYSHDIIDNLFIRRTFQDLAGYPRMLGIVDLRPLRGRHAYKSLLEVGPARLLAAMLGDLGVSTLRLITTMTQFFLSFWSIKPAMLSTSMLGDYSTSASSTPSCFPCHTDLLGNPFLITSILDLLFLLFSFLDHHTGHPARHDARILLMSASSMPSEFFIVVSIYWKSASYRSSLDLSTIGKTINRSAAKLIYFSFFFWTDVHAIRPVDSSTTSS
jgi:hypothetical protein